MRPSDRDAAARSQVFDECREKPFGRRMMARISSGSSASSLAQPVLRFTLPAAERIRRRASRHRGGIAAPNAQPTRSGHPDVQARPGLTVAAGLRRARFSPTSSAAVSMTTTAMSSRSIARSRTATLSPSTPTGRSRRDGARCGARSSLRTRSRRCARPATRSSSRPGASGGSLRSSTGAAMLSGVICCGDADTFVKR